MPDTGVTDMAVYVPNYYLALEDLAKERGIPPDKFLIGLGNEKMSVIPDWEDAVTMAANAAIQLLEKTGTDPDELNQLVVSTESSVDHSKAVASYVQGLLGIGTRCRVYEIKHACYGGTAGLVNSIDRISRYAGSCQKGIVIMTDIAKYGFNSHGEPTQGAGAVALLVERNPRLFSIDTSLNGIYSKNVFDFWRPVGHHFPIVNGKYSIECFLTALDGAVSHFRENIGIKRGKLLESIDYLVYHMPFTNMAKKAHRHLVDLEYKGRKQDEKEQIFNESFLRMVEPGLLGVREVGNIYTGSVYMGLISLLEKEGLKSEGKRVGVFSYGSGCGAEFMLCHINYGIVEIINKLRFKEQLDIRKKITFEQYDKYYSKADHETNFCHGDVDKFKNEFTKFIFTGIQDHKREYI